jgi:hypothetical protein
LQGDRSEVGLCGSPARASGLHVHAAIRIIAFEGDSHVEWFEGNFQDYEEDKKRRLGEDSVMPKRVKYKQFAPSSVETRSILLREFILDFQPGHAL